MASQIELISDEKGLAVIGDPEAVERFLDGNGLLEASQKFSLKGLSKMLQAASGAVEGISAQIRDSGRYIKLTKESAELRKTLGLTPTKTRGTSYAMLGDPGKIGKWLKIEERPSSLFTNPTVLSGVSGLLAQAAKQHQASEFRDLLIRIDKKLDDVRRRQKDTEMNKLDGIALAIQEATEIRDYGGNVETAWEKVLSRSTAIYEVQGAGLRELKTLADCAAAAKRVGSLVSATREIEHEAGIWVSVLARSFELRNEFEVLELQRVALREPKTLDGHRRALKKQNRRQRDQVTKQTLALLKSLDSAGDIAAKNIVLHARAAHKIMNSVYETTQTVQGLHAPLGLDVKEELEELPAWWEAVRDKEQLKTAGKEMLRGLGTIVAAGAVGAGALTAVGQLSSSNKEAQPTEKNT